MQDHISVWGDLVATPLHVNQWNADALKPGTRERFLPVIEGRGVIRRQPAHHVEAGSQRGLGKSVDLAGAFLDMGEISFPIVRDMDTNMYERQEGTGLEIGSYAHRPILYEPEDLPSVEEAALTPTEFRLLWTLIRQPGRPYSRNELMDVSRGEDATMRSGLPRKPHFSRKPLCR